MSKQEYRIGLGYDIHRLVEGRELIIGGVKITHEKGLLGHSDADVLVHAIIDGLLGALALDDIGTLFPDTDPQYKDADSLVLLKKVYEKTKDFSKNSGAIFHYLWYNEENPPKECDTCPWKLIFFKELKKNIC